MNILTFTTLWPNAEQPNFGIFVKHRVAAMAKQKGTDIRVVAPVPHFPEPITRLLPRPLLGRLPRHWLQRARLPESEDVGGLATYHPRYLVTPKIGMSFYGGWMARGALETVRRLDAERRIDLIDAHYVYPDGYAATLLGRQMNIPVFITARGTDINLFSRMPLIRPKIIEALNRAAGVVAVSEALKRRMVELGVAAEKIAVVRNGVDREVFHPVARKTARRKLGLDPGDQIILTVGALVPAKGIDRLVQAMALLMRESCGSRLRLFVIGEGPERKVIESHISKLNLQDRIHLIGAMPQAELADWYSAADLFCLASRREGCPNVVIEAVACGLPVVAANVGGVAELVGPACGKVVSLPVEGRWAAVEGRWAAVEGRWAVEGRLAAENLATEIRAALEVNWAREEIVDCSGVLSWDEVAAEVLGYYTRRGLPRGP